MHVLSEVVVVFPLPGFSFSKFQHLYENSLCSVRACSICEIITLNWSLRKSKLGGRRYGAAASIGRSV